MLISLLSKALLIYILYKVFKALFNLFLGFQVLKKQNEERLKKDASGQFSHRNQTQNPKDVFEAEYRVVKD